jgi:MFS family permease
VSDTPGRDAVAERGARIAIRRLIGLAVAHYTAGIGFRVAIALAAVGAGLAPSQIGLVLATFALVPMLLAVRGGQLVDRVGVRTPLRVGSALSALGAVCCVVLPHPALFVLGAGLAGLGGMVFHLGVQHAAGEIGGPTRRTRNFNLLTLSFSISGLLGPSLIGVSIDLLGHRVAFAVCALLLAVPLLGLHKVDLEAHCGGRPEPGDATRNDADDAPDLPLSASAAREGAFALLGTPRIRRLLGASLLASAAWDTYQFVLPLHANTIGLSAASVGLAISAFSAGSLTVRLLLPRLVERMHPARWMQVALVVCVLAYAVVPFATGLPLLLMLSFLIGVGPGIAQPLLMAALHGASPPGRAGEAAGLRMTLMSALQLALPVALGLIAGALGSAPIFWLYAGTAALIGAALARAHGR